MRRGLRLVLSAVFALSLSSLCSAQTLEKFDTLRLENEMTFDVPLEKGEEVWSWLTQTFGKGFQSKYATFQTFPEVEEFADTYFDVPEMTLISQGIGVRHRRRFYPNGEIKELIQIKQPHAPVGAGAENEKQTRGEVKFELRAPTITYRERSDFLNEELLLITKRDHVPMLRERLRQMGVNPERVRPYLAIEQQRRRIYFRENGSQFLTVTLDFAASQKLWTKGRFVQLDIEIGEIAFTTADDAKREKLLSIQRELQEKIQQRFPELRRNQIPKVVQMVSVIRGQGLLSALTLRYGAMIPLVLGLSVLCLVVWLKGRRLGPRPLHRGQTL